MPDCNCSEKERLTRIDERLHLGDITLNSIDMTLKVLKETQDKSAEMTNKMYKRMFVDNGKKSFQSSLSNMGVHIRLQWFFIGAIVIAVIGGSIRIWMAAG